MCNVHNRQIGRSGCLGLGGVLRGAVGRGGAGRGVGLLKAFSQRC